MPGGCFAELNRGERSAGAPHDVAAHGPTGDSDREDSDEAWRASRRKIRTNRARPVLEGLEGRQLLSGTFSHNGTEFSYTTPTGGHATIRIVGIGNLAGTTISRLVPWNWSMTRPTLTRRSWGKSTVGVGGEPAGQHPQ